MKKPTYHRKHTSMCTVITAIIILSTSTAMMTISFHSVFISTNQSPGIPSSIGLKTWPTRKETVYSELKA